MNLYACICLCASCGQHPACFLHLSLTHSFCLYVCESVCHRLCRVLWLLCIFSLYLFANSIPKSNCFYSKLLVANKQLIPSSCLGQCAACSIYFVHGLFRCSCFFFIYIYQISVSHSNPNYNHQENMSQRSHWKLNDKNGTCFHHYDHTDHISLFSWLASPCNWA